MNKIYLLVERNVTKLIGPIDKKDLRETIKFFKGQGYKVSTVPEPPSFETLRKWNDIGGGYATDGCAVVGWSSCSHGCRSWLAIFRKELS